MTRHFMRAVFAMCLVSIIGAYSIPPAPARAVTNASYDKQEQSNNKTQHAQSKPDDVIKHIPIGVFIIFVVIIYAPIVTIGILQYRYLSSKKRK